MYKGRLQDHVVDGLTRWATRTSGPAEYWGDRWNDLIDEKVEGWFAGFACGALVMLIVGALLAATT